MTVYQMKRHATEDVSEPERSLCGEKIGSAMKVDNANPTCKRCERCIASRLRKFERTQQRVAA